MKDVDEIKEFKSKKTNFHESEEIFNRNSIQIWHDGCYRSVKTPMETNLKLNVKEDEEQLIAPY